MRAAVHGLPAGRSGPAVGPDVLSLTRAQLRVLRLVAEGLSNAAIAERLGIQERSVESHLLAIYRHLGLDGKASNRRVGAVLAFLAQSGCPPWREPAEQGRGRRAAG